MKILPYSIIFLLIAVSCANKGAPENSIQDSNSDSLFVERQNNTEEENIREQETEIEETSENLKSFILNDTTFLIREHLGGCGYHAVYIEKNRKRYHNLLTDFEFHGNDQRAYNSYMTNNKKEMPGGLKSFDLDSLPQHWVSLYLFEGKYYLYAPSDWGTIRKTLITNSTIIGWSMEGPMPAPIIKLRKKENYYSFDFYSASGSWDNPQSHNHTIYIVDPRYKIAVWKYKSKEGNTDYSLMVPREYAGYFDVIVNHNTLCKMGEVEFDDPDYKALISKFN